MTISYKKDIKLFIVLIPIINLVSMLDTSKALKFGKNYGLGIYKWTLDNKLFYGHGGFYGSILAYSPDYQITISSNIGQAFPPFKTGKLIDKVIQIISN